MLAAASPLTINVIWMGSVWWVFGPFSIGRFPSEVSFYSPYKSKTQNSNTNQRDALFITFNVLFFPLLVSSSTHIHLQHQRRLVPRWGWGFHSLDNNMNTFIFRLLTAIWLPSQWGANVASFIHSSGPERWTRRYCWCEYAVKSFTVIKTPTLNCLIFRFISSLYISHILATQRASFPASYLF